MLATPRSHSEVLKLRENIPALKKYVSAVLEAPLSHLKRTITKPKKQKNKTLQGHLFWGQEELLSEKNQHQKSRDTVPLSVDLTFFGAKSSLVHVSKTHDFYSAYFWKHLNNKVLIRNDVLNAIS